MSRDALGQRRSSSRDLRPLEWPASPTMGSPGRPKSKTCEPRAARMLRATTVWVIARARKWPCPQQALDRRHLARRCDRIGRDLDVALSQERPNHRPRPPFPRARSSRARRQVAPRHFGSSGSDREDAQRPLVPLATSSSMSSSISTAVRSRILRTRVRMLGVRCPRLAAWRNVFINEETRFMTSPKSAA